MKVQFNVSNVLSQTKRSGITEINNFIVKIDFELHNQCRCVVWLNKKNVCALPIKCKRLSYMYIYQRLTSQSKIWKFGSILKNIKIPAVQAIDTAKQKVVASYRREEKKCEAIGQVTKPKREQRRELGNGRLEGRGKGRVATAGCSSQGEEERTAERRKGGSKPQVKVLAALVLAADGQRE